VLWSQDLWQKRGFQHKCLQVGSLGGWRQDSSMGVARRVPSAGGWKLVNWFRLCFWLTAGRVKEFLRREFFTRQNGDDSLCFRERSLCEPQPAGGFACAGRSAYRQVVPLQPAQRRRDDPRLSRRVALSEKSTAMRPQKTATRGEAIAARVPGRADGDRSADSLEPCIGRAHRLE
jgi:hypothetical protein